MSAARAAVLALITCAGVGIPAASAHAEDPILCGLVTPCDGEGDGGGGSQPAPVDGSADVDLDLGSGADTGADTNADTGVDTDVQLFPDSATVLTADTDAEHAALQLAAADNSLDTAGDTALDTDASIGQNGIVVTGNGAANAMGDASTWQRFAGVDAANQFCGVQVVIAADSSASCQPNASTGGASSNEGMTAVAESVDVCGAHVVVAGSASTDCGDSSPTGSPAAGSSSTLANAAAAGTLCGVSIAVAGESDTTCAATAQEAPVPGADPNGSGPGTPGTGATGTVEGAASLAAAGGQAQATPYDQGNSGTTAGESRGSLPLTGTSVLLFLELAAAVVATGLVAVRSSRVRVGHQS